MNESNGLEDRQLGLGTVTYNLRQNDYYLIWPVLLKEIWDKLKKMKSNSWPGTDGTSTKALRLGRTILIPM